MTVVTAVEMAAAAAVAVGLRLGQLIQGCSKLQQAEQGCADTAHVYSSAVNSYAPSLNSLAYQEPRGPDVYPCCSSVIVAFI